MGRDFFYSFVEILTYLLRHGGVDVVRAEKKADLCQLELERRKREWEVRGVESSRPPELLKRAEQPAQGSWNEEIQLSSAPMHEGRPPISIILVVRADRRPGRSIVQKEKSSSSIIYIISS